MKRRMPFYTTVLAVAGLAGCASVPRASLDAYQDSFAIVSSQAQDLYLRSEIIAEDLANRPETTGTVSEKLKQLEARQSALRTRLEALDLINHYNTLLSQLAAGTTAEGLKGQVTGLQQDLSSFDVSGITNLVQKAVPYVGIVTQGVTVVEDAIKKAKFRDAIKAAQQPLLGIIDILIADADDLVDITVEELKREQDPYREQISAHSRRFNGRIMGLKLTPETTTTAELQALLFKINEARQSTGRADFKPLSPQAGSNAVEPAPVDIDALTALAGQITISVLAYNKVEQQIKAQHALIAGYKKALVTTKKTFVALAGDVQATQILATSDFIDRAVELKRAALQVQEAK